MSRMPGTALDSTSTDTSTMPAAVLALSVIGWPVVRLVRLVVVENSSGVAPGSMVISPTNLPLPGWVADTTPLPASFGERMEALQLAHSGEFRSFVLLKYSTAM